MLKVYMMLLVLGIIGSAVGGAYFYYQDTQERIATLQENNAKLEIVAKNTQATLDSFQADYERVSGLNNELQENLKEAETYKDQLINQLQDHDLSRLSLKKPGLIETRINNGTRKVFEDIESITRPSVVE
tara:strand:- start:25 stop:414 length:390 start_codon:yes stop_codon:yes gene_type:complete